ncbi:MAG: hypothetical protein K0R08_2308 [Solimicrobium sp.]|jgi:hypothetical protein|nr:hypothetical protein [Solimicrobium sp.]
MELEKSLIANMDKDETNGVNQRQFVACHAGLPPPGGGEQHLVPENNTQQKIVSSKSDQPGTHAP